MREAPPIRPPAVAAAGAGAGPGSLAAATGAGGQALLVDPRISARRVAVRRAEGQRRLRRLAWVGGAAGLLLVAMAVTRTPALDLDHLEVAGTDDPAVAEVLAAAGIRPGRPLVDLDLARGESALEDLPWIADAEVRRRWPGTVEVDVTARLPVASVPVAGGTALVAADGVVVAIQPAPSPLVAVEAPPTLAVGDEVDRLDLLEVAAALPDQVRPLVGSVGGGDDDVELRLAQGGVVRLGAADELDDKLLAAATALTQVDLGCVDIIDVRVPSVFTVTRRVPC